MSTILAAVDNSAAARPVLRAARLFGELLGASVQAVHVRVTTTRTAQAQARAAGVPIRILDGDPVEALSAALADDDVVLGVFGARQQPSGRRPAGHTTLVAATQSSKPVLVVPPQANVCEPGQHVRVIVPLDGTPQTDRGARAARRLFDSESIEVTILHVFAQGDVPRFWDQPYHDQEAWAHEFVARHWPLAAPRIRLEHGAPAAAVLATANAEKFDVIALAWGQHLNENHAEVVRTVLTEASVPVLLLPATKDPTEVATP